MNAVEVKLDEAFFAPLKDILKGELLLDEYSKAIYATDASLYQILPDAIALPKDNEDVIAVLKFAYQNSIPVLPRGGATSLAGQTVGTGIVIDFSKYLTQILDLNVEEKWIWVQPGISRDDLNASLEKYGLCFAPDPATSSRANIGGMVANNSSGTKSILYGKTVDHVLELKIALPSGEKLHFFDLEEKTISEISNQDSTEGHIYKQFRKLIFEHSEEIERVFPKVMRRVGGYNLDEFIHSPNWNLSKLITGSEGTLATILEVKLNLVPLPQKKALTVIHFKDRLNAIQAVEQIIPYKPSAVELLDNTVLELSKNNLLTAKHSSWIKGQPGAVLIVEFYGDTIDEISIRFEKMVDHLKTNNFGYHYPFYPEGDIYNDVWLVRKKGLGLLLGKKGRRKAIAFIEDSAIHLKDLPNYINEVVGICDKYGVEAAVYAHASVGVIHIRPFLDMKNEADIQLFKKIGDEVLPLVIKYKGSLSGEHGDGLVRSEFNKSFFGDRIYSVFEDVKTLFDPKNIMNPGKIVDAPPRDSNLRYGGHYSDKTIPTVFQYREEGSFQGLVHMCNGVGECRRKKGGTMCPSYKATLDEHHSTRGRANALRMTMSGQMTSDRMDNPDLLRILDLCLSCKACKSECPSNVDMAKLKSEVWQLKYDNGLISPRERLIRNSSQMAKRFSGPLAGVVNFFQKQKWVKSFLSRRYELSDQRDLPEYSSESLSSWYRKNYKSPKNSTREVVLFADTYSNYHEPKVGKSAISLLLQLGYKVRLLDIGCCQRPRISNGFLRAAKEEGTKIYKQWSEMIKSNVPVLVMEPSCFSALKQDLPDLLENEYLGRTIANQIQTLESFVAANIKENPTLHLRSKFSSLLYHGHCHEKTLYGTQAIHAIFNRIPELKFEEITSGCCGMAGSFGYEKEHYQLSKKIAEIELSESLQKANGNPQIISSGFSCRHQIRDVFQKNTLHWVEVVEIVDASVTSGAE